MKKEKIILIGGGGHCRSCIDVIEEQDKFQIVGIIDQKEKVGQSVFGYDIIGSDDDIAALSKEVKNYFITIGQIKSSAPRVKISQILKSLGVNCPVIISPRAHVSKRAEIKGGSIIMHNALVNAGAMVGEYCIVNSKALIEHDVQVGDFTHISTNATINGDVIIGNNVFVGSGSVTRQGVEILSHSFIKASSLVK